MFYDADDDEDLFESEETPIPREYGINFSTGQLTGEIVEGSEALKVWAWFALQIRRYAFSIYSWDYGSELDSLIGKTCSEDYLYSLTQKMIEDCLLVNEHIKAIKNLVITAGKKSVVISFTMKTEYGDEELNV